MSSIQPFQPAVVDLSRYNADKYNVLVPTVQAIQVSPLYRIRVVEVKADSDPNAGDVFKVGSRYDKESKGYIDLFSPQKALLERLANAAGVIFSPTECRLVRRTPRLAYYTAVGARRMPSGEWAVAPGSKEIDLDVIEDEMRLQYADKANDAGKAAAEKYKGEWVKKPVQKGDKTYYNDCYVIAPEDRQRYISDMVTANMIQWRKNLVHRAETGAKLRVIRSLIGMKSTYTADELAKPFVMTTVDFAPDYRDQQVKQMMIRQGMQAMGSLYGAPAAVPATIWDAEQLPEAPEEEDGIPAVVHTVAEEAPAEKVSETSRPEDSGEERDGADEGTPESGQEEKPAPNEEQEEPGPVKCEHQGCTRTLSDNEKRYSEKKCDGYYCMTHQRFHLKAGG